MVQEWNEENFDQQIQTSDLPVLADMYAVWCGPCKMMAPVLDELSRKREGQLVVAKVDIDQAPRLTQQYGIMSVPTLLLFKKGALKKKIVGMRNLEDLEQEISQVLQ